ncbi:Ger(x)C family spore germination protein [Aneurinibacillus aneurinilyticus]|uniref:Germination protein, Ger(X)C family n=1 Tax=Aneurinibacillus aneurinilyticus ATCC 12856 TaxID=649747 RepID=U1WXB8_ANEAE|nr:Ger(x)C family spore germination protein [Aneurinibacillus aneurinilyticus]ERI07320.1 germination protein, Ger(x)C family [Aneurinibacillus aneurinilyticus ATCC 12856]MED0709703.1 Ger(x)C family spore germination protein [Aneurinibacillus aneurinilyticus]MED0726463.1 Ger(x)C family spore germination protein [Aneurinibacillus aneurinilyticus]MED0734935.1 Ger(x)C family spore germination protein [Aneurinibacillus aneurinilyticus]MED0741827.1 Ger(x)C family spore germination protein [Aneurinib
MNAYKFTAVLLLPFFLTGCWSKYEVQNMNYVTAVGIDYADGQYIIYAQLLDFSTVAKLEGQQKAEQPPVWIGRGKGISFTEAANDLYSTSQQRLNWGQISAILFSERLLKERKVGEVLELIDRYREIRYLAWVFSTRDPLDEVLIATPFFRLSPKASILHNPEQNYRQRSILAPIRLQRFVMDSNEKAKTSYIPELSVRKDQWKENQKPHELLRYSGIQIYDKDKYYARMSLEEIKGLPWLNKHTIRLPVDLFSDNKLVAVLVAVKPEYDVKPRVKYDKAYFDISVKVKAGVNELHADVTEQELTQLAQKEIEHQIRQTFQTAFEKRIDIYNLGESLFRKNPYEWKRIASGTVLNKDSLRNINVNVQIVYSGRYKLSP